MANTSEGDTSTFNEVDGQSLILSAFTPKAKAPEPTETKEEPETEVEEQTDEVSEAEVTEEQSEETEESDDVLSQIDLDALTDGQKAELATMLGSGAGKEIGKLRSEKKALEEERDGLRKQLESATKAFLPNDNQFANITDIAELDKRDEELRDDIAYFNPKIANDEWDTNDEGDEGIRGQDGKFYPKKDIVRGVLNALELQKHIAVQRQRIQNISNLKGYADSETKKATKELPWLADDTDSRYTAWKKEMDDPEMLLLQKVAPKVYATLARRTAHFIDSTTKPKKKIVIPTKRPNLGDAGGGSTSSIPGGTDKRKQAALERIQSGDFTDKDVLAGLINF